jgi:rubrerythrin
MNPARIDQPKETRMKAPHIIVASLEIARPKRRSFVATGVLSAAAVALLGGRDALAAKKHGTGDAAGDIAILNSALAAEYQAIAAYQVGAESGLLTAAVKPVALEFQGHHKAHADVLAGVVKKMGGQPVSAKSKYDFPVDQLKNQADVLQFAASLEKGAVSAYVGAVPKFNDRSLSQAAATILGDEAMHWAVLRQVLGEQPVPSAFVG